MKFFKIFSMKLGRKIFLIALFLITIFINNIILFDSCTKNPFEGGENIAPPKRTITGKVELIGDIDLRPDSVFIWLEGFKIGTYTNQDGNFTLILPPPATQTSQGGIDGILKLYYYIANFDLAITELVIRNGEFVYSKGEINARGELNHPKKLVQFLRIETRVTPSEISIGSVDSAIFFTVIFTLTAMDDTVTVFFPSIVGDIFFPVIFKNKQTGKISILRSFVLGPEDNEIRDVQILPRGIPFKRKVLVVFTPETLPPGEYEIIPYIIPKHEMIPNELLASIGKNILSLSPNYLKLPMKRTGGDFILKE